MAPGVVRTAARVEPLRPIKPASIEHPAPARNARLVNMEKKFHRIKKTTATKMMMMRKRTKRQLTGRNQMWRYPWWRTTMTMMRGNG